MRQSEYQAIGERILRHITEYNLKINSHDWIVLLHWHPQALCQMLYAYFLRKPYKALRPARRWRDWGCEVHRSTATASKKTEQVSREHHEALLTIPLPKPLHLTRSDCHSLTHRANIKFLTSNFGNIRYFLLWMCYTAKDDK